MYGRFSVSPNAVPSPNQPSFSLFAPFVRFSSSFFSIGCALLLRSFLSRATAARDAVSRKLTRFFSIASALFAKTAGVAWLSRTKALAPSRSFTLSLVKSILTKTRSRKLFRMNTYEKRRGGGPPPPLDLRTFFRPVFLMLLGLLPLIWDFFHPARRGCHFSCPAPRFCRRIQPFLLLSHRPPLTLPVHIRAIKRNYIAPMTRHTSIPVTMLTLALISHAAPLNRQQSH